jgi:hypothetical protein
MSKKPIAKSLHTDAEAELLLLGAFLVGTNHSAAKVIARALDRLAKMRRENDRLRAALAKEKAKAKVNAGGSQ